MDVRALRRAVFARLAALRAWATWTPRRAGTIAGVCIAVLVVSPLVAGLTRSAGDSSTAEAAATTTGEPVATPPSVPQGTQAGQAPVVTASPSGANDENVPIDQAHEEAAAGAGRRFAELWLAGAFVPDRQRWAATMHDLVDPSLMPFLEATPASVIPRTSVDSVVPRLVAPSYGAVRVTFADGTGMDLEMSARGTDWRVAQYLPTPSTAKS